MGQLKSRSRSLDFCLNLCFYSIRASAKLYVLA
nr:MAG TPA: hypothetical protein [Caudoviricetes sp.]